MSAPSVSEAAVSASSQPETLALKKAIDKLGNTGNVEWEENLQTAKRNLSIVSIGVPGTGKSSLLNGFIGRKFFDENRALSSQNQAVNKHHCQKGALDVTVWDCPSLEDGTQEARENLEQIARETREMGGIDLIFYCISMKEARSASLHDFSAVHSLTATLGQDIWKNSLIVLTFANIYEAQLCVVNPNISEKNLLRQFNSRVPEWKEQLVEQLVHAGVKREIASEVPVHPAGYHTQPHLPGHQYWASLLWTHAFAAVRSTSKPIMLPLKSEDGFKKKEIISDEIFRKELEDQPVIVTNQVKMIPAESAGNHESPCFATLAFGFTLAFIIIDAATSKIGSWQAAVGIGVCLAAAGLYALYKKQKRKKME